MTTVWMQWIGTPVLGLCLLLQGCAVGSSDLQYHLALDTDPAGQKSNCTVVLKSVVDEWPAEVRSGLGPALSRPT